MLGRVMGAAASRCWVQAEQELLVQFWGCEVTGGELVIGLM